MKLAIYLTIFEGLLSFHYELSAACVEIRNDGPKTNKQIVLKLKMVTPGCWQLANTHAEVVAVSFRIQFMRLPAIFEETD